MSDVIATIPTPNGALVIRNKNDEEYPGVYIDMHNGAPVATIEYTDCRNVDDTPGIQVLVWEDATEDEANIFINSNNFENF